MSRNLCLSLVLMFSSLSHGAVKCLNKPDKTLLLEKAEVQLDKQGEDRWAATFWLKYHDEEQRERKLEGLSCNFDKTAIHCWNSLGQAFNLFETVTHQIGFNHLAPQTYAPKTETKVQMLFMFHPRPWAEMGPDADKYQQLEFTKEQCRMD